MTIGSFNAAFFSLFSEVAASSPLERGREGFGEKESEKKRQREKERGRESVGGRERAINFPIFVC